MPKKPATSCAAESETSFKGQYRIPDALKPLEVPLDSLQPDPNNAMRHDDRNIAAIQESCYRFGQRKPIVHRNGVICAGSGTWEAFRRAGCIVIAAVDASDLTEDEAKAYGLADNRTAQLAEWDPDVLQAILQDLPPDLRFDDSWTAEELRAICRSDNTDGVEAAKLDASENTVPEQFMVLIECADESEQQELLERFIEEGLKCRALVS